MQLDWWTLALQTINFGILVWLLHRFLYKPVLAAIDARKTEARRQLDAAKNVEEQAKAELAVVEAERAGIAAEREASLRSAAQQAQEMADARRAQAERDAQSLLDSTRKLLASERERTLDEARRLALELGSDFAQRLLAEIPTTYRAEAWIERIEHYVNALSPSERAPLVRQLADGAQLTVVTATALPSATIGQWKARLGRSLGLSDRITFEVDPKLVAGAELHFPTTVLRFSWQSAVLAAQSELSAHDRPR